MRSQLEKNQGPSHSLESACVRTVFWTIVVLIVKEDNEPCGRWQCQKYKHFSKSHLRAASHHFNTAQEFKGTVNLGRQQEVQTAVAHFLAGSPSSLWLEFSTDFSQPTLLFLGLVEHVLTLSPILKNVHYLSWELPYSIAHVKIKMQQFLDSCSFFPCPANKPGKNLVSPNDC